MREFVVLDEQDTMVANGVEHCPGGLCVRFDDVKHDERVVITSTEFSDFDDVKDCLQPGHRAMFIDGDVKTRLA